MRIARGFNRGAASKDNQAPEERLNFTGDFSVAPPGLVNSLE
jgi:hypothetical protein